MAQSQPPLVPEGIHSDAKGPPELCGITGRDLADLERRVVADPSFTEGAGSDLYRVFNRERDFVQFVFPRGSTLTFPMATCRQVVEEANGSVSIRRELQCDGTREQCDRVFLEFEALDKRISD
jgi:hypothetical protein